MSKIARLIFIILLFIFFSANNIFASKYMGGEITWECIPAGQNDAGKYIFTMRVIRECGNNPFNNTINIYSNSPAGSISMTLLSGWPKDISPVCDISNFSGTSIDEITCAGAELSGIDNTGAMSEYLFRSAPIQLSGIPPSVGWIFYWSSCCRNPALNINGQPAYKLRAKMYAYGNMNMYPCFDNSPVFAESPKSVLLAGFPSEYSNYAFDKDLDSLTFEWGEPQDNLSSGITYNAGYTYNNPLPDTSENANNVGAIMDSRTGMVNYTSYTTGAFLVSVKVSSYREGQLVAEIWRETQTILLDAVTNTPPTIVINGGAVFQDTVEVGDTIGFIVSGSDFGFLPNGSMQTVDLSAQGSQFGSYIPSSGANVATFSKTVGCLRPPCASLTPAPDPSAPLASLIGVQSVFYWQTSPNHLLFDSTQGYSPYTYDFVFEFKDDYCPAPASKITIASITIEPPQMLMVPQIESAVKDQNSDIILKWSPITNDVDTLFMAYYIYAKLSNSTDFVLVDSITNPNIGTYSYTNYSDPFMDFRLGLKQAFMDTTTITKSIAISNMVLFAGNTIKCIFQLHWNPFCESDQDEYYKVFKKSTNGSWILQDSTFSTIYEDMTLWDLTFYKVESNGHILYDSLGNVSITKSETAVFSVYSTMSIGSDTVICSSGSFNILADNGFNNYEWQDGSTQNNYDVIGQDLGIGTHDIWLKATTLYGCEKTDSLVLEVEECISIDESENETSVEIFPNPTDGIFSLEIYTLVNQKLELEIVSVNGESVYKQNIDLKAQKSTFSIDISSVANGVYYIRIKGDNIDIVKPITVQK